MDEISRHKTVLSELLARRMRGTITSFIREWNKADPRDRAELIRRTSYKIEKFVATHQSRTNATFKNKRLYNPTDAQNDTRFVMGQVVDRLIANEGERTRSAVFINKVRKWATGTARRITQRNAESARFESAKRASKGVVYKAWSSFLDGQERPDHLDAHLRYAARPIPIDKPFRLGQRGFDMMFPGDVSLGAPPAQFMNCRCSVVFLNEHGEKI